MILLSACELEPHFVGFNEIATPIEISKRARVDHVAGDLLRLSDGGTDCSVPIAYALQNKIEADAILTLTDGETWAGNEHSSQVIRKFRKFRPEARLVNVQMCGADGHTNNDQKDPLSLDVVGFDMSTVAMVSEFVNGL